MASFEAEAQAEKVGWDMGPVSRESVHRRLQQLGKTGQVGQAAPPPIGEPVDISTFALQDLLTIVGAYTGPKDGTWSDTVMQALTLWGANRWTLTVIPKEEGQTLTFAPKVAWEALLADAQAGRTITQRAAPPPSWLWPLLIGGGVVVGLGFLYWIFKKKG